MRAILDTNVIALWAKKASRALHLIEALGITHAYITTISYIEVLGAAKLSDKLKTKKFLAQFTIAEFDQHTQRSAHYLCMRHEMKTKQAADFLIASVARAKGYTIITNNVKDFALSRGVKVIKYDE